MILICLLTNGEIGYDDDDIDDDGGGGGILWLYNLL
jgi:hypothetical protein